MSDYTPSMDHAKKAQEIIDTVFKIGGDMTENDLVCNMLLAQAHATLALAEQARIANLIALRDTDETREALFRPTAFSYELCPDIAAALEI
jgi:hypothetical protein